MTSIFLPTSGIIELSPTQIALAQVCMKQLGYYRARLKPLATPMNLLFGVCLHWVIEGWLRNYFKADEMGDLFVERLTKQRFGKLIAMSKTKSHEVFESIGRRLCEKFPAYFNNLGVVPVIVEGHFKINLGNGVILNLVIDFVGIVTRPIYDPEGNLIADVGDTVILDWKTAAMQAGELFTRTGYQLTYYWLAVTLACEKLGIKPPKLCGYASGLKPNIQSAESKSLLNAEWSPVHWTKRMQSDIDEAVDYARVVARRIRAGEFHRAPHMAYNSPCDSQTGRCTYTGPCLTGTLEGLDFIGRGTGLNLLDLI